MQQSKKVRYIIVLFLLGVSVVALVGWNICVGTVRIPLADIFASIRGEKIENSRILWDIRMPRTLAAMILGGALALAGYLLQTFFHNLFRCKNGGGTRHGISDGTGSKDHFLGIDCSGICRGNDLYGICAFNVTQSP